MRWDGKPCSQKRFLALVLGLAASIPLLAVLPIFPRDSVTLPSAPTLDIIDPPAAGITEASITPSFVKWGTTQPYDGNGPPGLRLEVEATTNIADWTVEGWANDTTPPPQRVCANSLVHFDPYDWIFESDGSGATNHGTFISTPTTVRERAGPAGDQCLARLEATGTWQIRVCLNLGGQPRGLYRTADGRAHFDDWDRCLNQVVQVA